MSKPSEMPRDGPADNMRLLEGAGNFVIFLLKMAKNYDNPRDLEDLEGKKREDLQQQVHHAINAHATHKRWKEELDHGGRK